MTEGKDSRRGIVRGLMMLSVATLGFVTYRDTFGYFFTASDALTQIETSRVESLKDIFRILTEPMMNGTKLLDLVLWYRPTSIFSYSLDYALWGLNPVGYHITDVLLHAMISVMTFELIRRLSGSLLAAYVGALLFTIHPVHVENVPAIARRHDAIAMLFMYISLFLFMRNYTRGERTRWVSVLSLVAFAAALGAKEIAPIFPVILFTYVAVDTYAGARSRADIRRWFGSALRPTIPYFVMTILYVVWRTWVLKGMGGEQWPAEASHMEIVGRYFKGLLDPYQFLDARFNPVLHGLFWAIAALWVYARVIKGKGGVGKPLAFFSVWLLLPLTIFLVTQSFNLRRIYVGVIPSCAIVALVILDMYRYARACVADFRARGLRATGSAAMQAATLAATAVVCVGFVAHSPLFSPFTDWRYSASFTKLFLTRFSAVIPELPEDARVYIHDLPFKFLKPTRTRPHVETPAGLLNYSVESWISLKHPGSRMNVMLPKRPSLEIPPSDVRLETEIDDDIIKIWVKYDFSSTTDPSITRRDLGKANIDIENYKKARDYLESYVHVEPKDHLGWAFLGEALLGLGDPSGAERALRRSLDLKDRNNDAAYLALVRALRGNRRYQEAIELSREWVDKSEDEASARRNVGWVFLSVRDYPRAIEAFERSLAIEKNTHSYRGLMMACVDGLGDYEKGKVYGRAWVENNKGESEAYFMLGLCFYMTGDTDEAIELLERSIRLGRIGEGAPYRAFDTLGTAKSRAGDVQGAIDAWKSSVEAYPDSAASYAHLAEAYVGLGNCNDARKWLSQAVAAGLAHPRQVEIGRAIDRCRQRQGAGSGS